MGAAVADERPPDLWGDAEAETHVELHDAQAAVRHAMPFGTVVTPLKVYEDGFVLSVRLPEPDCTECGAVFERTQGLHHEWCSEAI